MSPASDAPPLVFDPALRRRRVARAAGRVDAADYAFLRAAAAGDLADRVLSVTRSFAQAAEIGGGGAFAQVRADSGELTEKVRALVATDLATGALRGVAGPRAVMDPERSAFADARLDLVVSPLALHWTNDLPGALIQIRRALKPDGLFVAALFGGATLRELRACLLEAETAARGGAGARVSPFADAYDMAGLLQRAGFALPVADTETTTVRYADPIGLLRDLRGMGETAAFVDRSAGPLTRGVLQKALQLYAERFADPDGRVRATFEILYVTGWAPADSQPKPLKPGSAKTRLADALGVKERPAGDKAGPRG